MGNHFTNTEIITNKYNIVIIFNINNEIKKYISLLNKMNIKQVKQIITVCDYFNNENSGECYRINIDEKIVHDVIDILTKEAGLYFVERREY